MQGEAEMQEKRFLNLTFLVQILKNSCLLLLRIKAIRQHLTIFLSYLFLQGVDLNMRL